MQIIDSTPAALSADLQMYLRNGDVFFDIETTGLSWRTSHLYLIGALFFDPAADTFTLRQWFLDRRKRDACLFFHVSFRREAAGAF